MKRDINSATELASVDSEDVDLALRGGDQDIVLAGVDVEAGDLAVVDEELGQRSDSKSVISHFDELLLDAVRSSEGEDAELGLLGVHWSKMIDEVTAVRVISQVVSLHNLGKSGSRSLSETRHLLLDISEPSESSTNVIGTHETCIVRHDSDLLIAGEVDRLNSCLIITNKLWGSLKMMG